MIASCPHPECEPPHRYVQPERCPRCDGRRTMGEPGWRCCTECDWDERTYVAPIPYAARQACPSCSEDRLMGEAGWRCCMECGWDELPRRSDRIAG